MSDPHAGFSQGLANPETVLRDALTGEENPINLNTAQSILWKIFSTGLEEISHLAGKDEIFAFCMGDITHGNKHLGEQVSTRMSDQTKIAFHNFIPVMELKQLKRLRIGIGTGAHEYGEGTSDDILTWMLRLKYPKKDTRTFYHGLAKIGGIIVDYAHHGPAPGSRNWTKGNSAKAYLMSMMMSDLDAGVEPPNLVLRGHYHTYVKEWCGISRNGNDYESWIMIMPALCLLGDYGKQITSSVYRISPGLVAVEVINEKINATYRYSTTLDLRTHEDFDGQD